MQRAWITHRIRSSLRERRYFSPRENGADNLGEYVAQFQTTIALTKNGTVRLSGPAALDTSKVKSEKKLEDEELLKLIAEPLKAGKPKNKKKKKTTGDDKADEEEEGK
jgi:hypothetical protein